MYLLLIFVIHLTTFGCWHGSPAEVCGGLSPGWGSSFKEELIAVRLWACLALESFIWGVNIHSSGPGFPWAVYLDPLDKHSKVFFSFLFLLFL